jgi:hypothetical protein
MSIMGDGVTASPLRAARYDATGDSDQLVASTG